MDRRQYRRELRSIIIAYAVVVLAAFALLFAYW